MYLFEPHVVDDVAPPDGVGLHVLRHELHELVPRLLAQRLHHALVHLDRHLKTYNLLVILTPFTYDTLLYPCPIPGRASFWYTVVTLPSTKSCLKALMDRVAFTSHSSTMFLNL